MSILEQMAGVSESTIPTEETQTTPETSLETEVKEPEISERTDKDIEPSDSTEATEPPKEKIDPNSPEGIAKALKDTKAALTKLQQERAAEEKAKTEKAKTDELAKIETEKAKVSEQEKQVNKEYNEKIAQLKTNKTNLLKEYQANPTNPIFEGMSLYQLGQTLDTIYENSKQAIDVEYSNKAKEVQTQQQNIYTQTVARNHTKAEEILGDKLKNPVIKQVWEGIKALNLPSPHLAVQDFMPIFEKALADHQETISKEFAGNQAREASKKNQPKLDGSHIREAGSTDSYSSFEKLWRK